MQFKKGDKVIIVKDTKWGRDHGLIGKEGTVTSSDEDWVYIKIPTLSLSRVYLHDEITHLKQYYLRKYAQSRNT